MEGYTTAEYNEGVEIKISHNQCQGNDFTDSEIHYQSCARELSIKAYLISSYIKECERYDHHIRLMKDEGIAHKIDLRDNDMIQYLHGIPTDILSRDDLIDLFMDSDTSTGLEMDILREEPSEEEGLYIPTTLRLRITIKRIHIVTKDGVEEINKIEVKKEEIIGELVEKDKIIGAKRSKPSRVYIQHIRSKEYLHVDADDKQLSIAPLKKEDKGFQFNIYRLYGMDEDTSHPATNIVIITPKNTFIKAMEKCTENFTGNVLLEEGKIPRSNIDEYYDSNPQYFALHKKASSECCLESRYNPGYFLGCEYNGDTKAGDRTVRFFRLLCDSYKNHDQYGVAFHLINVSSGKCYTDSLPTEAFVNAQNNDGDLHGSKNSVSSKEKYV